MNILKLILSDWKRYTDLHKKMNPTLFLVVFFRNPGMYFSVFYRLQRFLLYNRFIPLKILGVLFYPIYFIITYYILDLNISPRAVIGEGLYIHNRGVIIADITKAGKNLTLVGPLTLGTKGYGISEDPTGPTLGDDVKVFAGARIIGPVSIGNNVYVGANAVVVKDIPSNCIVGGVPAKIIKRIGHEK